jgi:N-acetylmuramoyl-L-alanine amidase
MRSFGKYPVEQPHTGATWRSAPPSRTRVCPSCGSVNPARSLLCESCSTRIPAHSLNPRSAFRDDSVRRKRTASADLRTAVSAPLMIVGIVVALTVITAFGGYVTSKSNVLADANRIVEEEEHYSSPDGGREKIGFDRKAEASLVIPSQPDPSLIRSLGLKVSRIVLDPGHGGQDTGTVGPTGLTEKEFVLDVARRLKNLIQRDLEADVVMTRSDDALLPLEERTRIANEAKGDLLISIHANSSPRLNADGVETFFLSLPDRNERDVLEVSARENAAARESIHDLDDLLRKITLHYKRDESRELARQIQFSLSRRKQMGENRGVKQAAFIVLIGAKMPAVLAEIGFISNPAQERDMKTSWFREQTAEGLLGGIKSYLETLKSGSNPKPD